MAGRPRKPAGLHVANGTYRADRHGGKLDVPDVSLGEAPEWFDDVARAEWIRLAEMKHIKAAHKAEVEHYCVLYSRMIDDARGVKDMSSSSRQMLHSMSMQLGLTPASQGKIPAVPEDKKSDPWAKLA